MNIENHGYYDFGGDVLFYEILLLLDWWYY